MKRTSLILSIVLFLSQGLVFGQDGEEKTVKTKKGWKLGGVVPAIAYDSDIGFRYGALANFYDYGDGTVYPDYLKSLYVEWSKTTKGSGTNNISFENKRLFDKPIRMLADLNYLTEQALDFYGFNGYQADFNPAYSNDDPANEDYISRMYYRHDRRLLRMTLDVQGQIIPGKLEWYGGLGFFGLKASTIDRERMNEGKDEAEQLPDVPTLYDEYISYGIISADEADGGNVTFLKAGAVFDTRDNEPNPFSGIWTEALVLVSPGFMSAGNYSMLSVTHRQYFTLVPERVNFAFRASYQQKLTGTIPFYMLPFYNTTKKPQDGLGGSKTLRGILRNRVVGDAVAFTNLELRWKFLNTVVFGQDFYIALSSFLDAGRVTQRYEFTQDPGTPSVWVGDENWHLGYGAGLHFAINQNFIVAVDYGLAASEQDGSSGLYIGLNFLY